MQRFILPIVIIIVALSLVPFAILALARSAKKPGMTRIQLIPDMDQQPRFKTQRPNPMFADGRAMRHPVEGTVSRQNYKGDLHYYRGIVSGTWATTFPNSVAITEPLLKRGQERFDIYCTPCHGYTGEGNGIVYERALKLEQVEFIQPSVLIDDLVRDRPVGHIFNTISHGIRTMPSYGAQIAEEDRWAIVAYVRALQRSQKTSVEDVPADVRPSLR